MVYYIKSDSLNPWLPSREQHAQVLRVSSLLDEMVDLSADTQWYSILNPFQFFLQPDQNPLCYLVEVRALASGCSGLRCVEDVSSIVCRGVFSMFWSSLKVEGLEGTQSPLVERVMQQDLIICHIHMTVSYKQVCQFTTINKQTSIIP